MAQVRTTLMPEEPRRMYGAHLPSQSIWGSYSPEDRNNPWGRPPSALPSMTNLAGSAASAPLRASRSSSGITAMGAAPQAVQPDARASNQSSTASSPVGSVGSFGAGGAATPGSVGSAAAAGGASGNATASAGSTSSSSGSVPTDDDLILTAIVVKNIPFAIKKEQLIEVMTQLGLPLPYAFNYHFDSGVFRGLAFANFGTAEETAVVIANLNGREIGGRKLRVEYKKMLPQQERERIEREKRERRGQLEEQHVSPSNSPPPQQIKQPQLDFNDQETLDLYTSLVMFQSDLSRAEIYLQCTPAQMHILQVLCSQLNLSFSPAFDSSALTITKPVGLAGVPEFPSPIFRTGRDPRWPPSLFYQPAAGPTVNSASRQGSGAMAGVIGKQPEN